MRHGLMSTARAVHVVSRVTACCRPMSVGTRVRISGGHRGHMFVNMIAMRVMQVAVVQKVGVTIVKDRKSVV